MKTILFLGLALVFSFTSFAQSKADLLNSEKEITWLGLDFTQMKFIGSATQWKDAGEITDANMRDKFFPVWNNLIVNEPKKYDVAGAVGKTEVKSELDITEKSNNTIKGNIFSEDANDYARLDEARIHQIVGKYNFQGKKGIGMMIFVEAMSKGKEEAAGWVTFVDMDKKKVLLTKRVTGKAGGFGFRNYWAKSFFFMIKEVKSNLKSWVKG